MSFLLPLLIQLLHIGLMLAAAPTITGLIDWLTAGLAGRPEPPVLSPWRELIRLSRQTAMKPVTVASGLMPAGGLGSTLAAAALVPSFALGMALSPLADLLVVVGLLGVAQIAEVIMTLDVGVRMPTLAPRHCISTALLAEPVLMLSVLPLALMSSSFNLEQLMTQQRDGPLLPVTALVIAFSAFLVLAVVDVTRPMTGIEHMLSGVDLGMYRLTGWIRRLIWFDLLGGLFLPIGIAPSDGSPIDWLFGLACWSIKTAGCILGLAWFQTMLGCFKHDSRANVVVVAVSLALLAIVIVIANAGGV